MRRRVRFIVIAAAVLALLVLAAILAPRFAKPAPEPQDGPQAALTDDEFPLVSEDLETLAAFSIEGADGGLLTFAPDAGGSWRVYGHPDLDTSYFTLDAAAFYACHFTAAVKIDDYESLADYGLEKPYARVTSDFKNGESRRVSLGDLSPDGDYRYAAVDGDPALYMVYARVSEYFDPTGDFYVDKPIRELGIRPAEVDYVRLAVKDKPLIEMAAYDASTVNPLEMYGTGQLLMASPVVGRPVYMENFEAMLVAPINELYMERLEAIAPQSAAAYGLDAPWLDLTLSSLNAAFRLRVGNEAGDGLYYCAVDDAPSVFTIQAEPLAKLRDAEPLMMVSRFISILAIDTVDTIDIDAFGKQTHISVGGHYEKGAMPDGSDSFEIRPRIGAEYVTEAAFKTFYGALIGMSYEALRGGDAHGDPPAPAITVVFTLTDGKTVTNRFYPHDDKFYAIHSDYYGEESGIDYLIGKLYADETIGMIQDVLSGKLDE